MPQLPHFFLHTIASKHTMLYRRNQSLFRAGSQSKAYIRQGYDSVAEEALSHVPKFTDDEGTLHALAKTSHHLNNTVREANPKRKEFSCIPLDNCDNTERTIRNTSLISDLEQLCQTPTKRLIINEQKEMNEKQEEVASSVEVGGSVITALSCVTRVIHFGPRVAVLCGLITSGALGSLDTLWLRDNRIGDVGMKAFAAAIGSGSLPNLKELNLAENEIHDAGLQEFAVAIGSGSLPTLKRLWLNENQISDDGVSALVSACTSGAPSQLTFLNLRINKIGNAGIRALAGAINGGKMISLRRLFARINMYNDDAEEELQDACEPHKITCDL